MRRIPLRANEQFGADLDNLLADISRPLLRTRVTRYQIMVHQRRYAAGGLSFQLDNW